MTRWQIIAAAAEAAVYLTILGFLFLGAFCFPFKEDD